MAKAASLFVFPIMFFYLKLVLFDTVGYNMGCMARLLVRAVIFLIVVRHAGLDL
ncbi:unnamed protein product [Brassica oleracea var. botrytis]